MTFKAQATAALLGIVTIGVPAWVINTLTLNINPRGVFLGVVAACLFGFALSSWLQLQDHDEAPGAPVWDDDDPSTCDACGFPTDVLHSGWHALNCAGSGSNDNYEEGWQQP